MKKRMGRILLFAVGVLLWSILFPFSAVAFGQTGRVLKVAFPEAKGINETHEDGTHSGVFYDWLVEIAKYTGWEYEFITGEPENLIADMFEGKYDLMGGMFYRPSFEEYFSYPQYDMGSNYSLLISRKEDDSIKSFDMKTLNGKTIGVFGKATDKIQRLDQFLSFNGVKYELKYYYDDESYNNCLKNHEVDMLLANDIEVQSNYNVVAKFNGEPYYIVTGKEQKDICEELNRAMTEIYEANPNFASELYDAHFSSIYNNSIFLSEQDINFIQASAPIKVAVLKERYPLNYSREEIHYGIDRDIFELIFQRTGLKFEFVYGETYQEILDMVQNGEADIVGSFFDNEYAAAKQELILTKPYVSLGEVILKNKKSSYPSKELTLALVEGRDIPKDIYAEKVKYYSTFEACIDALEAGKADFTRIPASFVEDLFYKNYYAHVTIVAANNTENKIAIALPKPVNVRLYAVLNKAINTITKSEIDTIVSKNLTSLGDNKITLKSMIYSNPIAFIIICSIILILFMLLLLLIGRFRMNSRLMKLELEKAVEAGKAKSDFLSQMSHEIRTPMNAIIGLTNVARLSGEATPALQVSLEKIDVSAQFLLSLVNDILDMSKIESSKMKITLEPFSLSRLLEEIESMVQIQGKTKGIQMRFQCGVSEDWFLGDPIRIKQILANLLSNALKFTEQNGTILLEITEEVQKNTVSEIKFSVKDNGIGIKKEDLKRIFNSFEQAANAKRNVQGTGLGLAISSNLVKLMGGELSVKSEPGKGSEFYFTLGLARVEQEIEGKDTGKKQEHILQGMRLLLAEDNDLNSEIVVSLLQMKEILVERAANGQEAVSMFLEHPAGYYDLILMDIQMPVKNGLDATREIRKIAREDAGRIPIIAMTANTFQDDREKVREVGMNDFIPKPFDIALFLQTLEKNYIAHTKMT